MLDIGFGCALLLGSSIKFLVVTKLVQIRALLLVLAAALLGSAAAWGQATATFSGAVTGPDGAAIAGASVRLFNALTGFERDMATDDRGAFEIRNIPLQSYELTVESTGFGTFTEVVALRTNIPVRREIQLSVAAQIESIDVAVNESATLIDTEATGTRTELHRSTITRMPVQAGARGLESVLLNFPGFAANANGAIHPRGAHNQMTYVIDGMPISDQFTGSFATSIDPSMVQSLELFTGDIPPEYGSKISGVANITTRSGLDFGGESFGNLEVAGGGFDTTALAVQSGGRLGKLGYFASVSAVRSNRFLDTPSLDNLHNGGNAERGFARFDYQWNDRTILRFNAMAGSLLVPTRELAFAACQRSAAAPPAARRGVLARIRQASQPNNNVRLDDFLSHDERSTDPQPGRYARHGVTRAALVDPVDVQSVQHHPRPPQLENRPRLPALSGQRELLLRADGPSL